MKNGGIRERMTAARLGYRNVQQHTIDELTREVENLKTENERLRRENEELRGRLGER